MGAKKNVLGLIFASMHDSDVIDLTKKRTMGSIPFGGRYRLIDFPLSNMVNSGIKEVGVITKSNYGSLLDHLGSGREWDLSSKNAVYICFRSSVMLTAVCIEAALRLSTVYGNL